MRKVMDYIMMRTPQYEPLDGRLGGSNRSGESGGAFFTRPPVHAGKVPRDRILLSLSGLLIGILASFYVTGLAETKMQQREDSSRSSEQEAISNETNEAAIAQLSEPQLVSSFTWKRFLSHGVIALVICMLTYQQLYLSLALYNQSPTFLILFVSFQYGYFWQSVIKGGAAVL